MYSYQICAVNAVGESERTPFVTFTTPPGAPTGITSLAQTGGTVTLSWQAPAVTSGRAVESYMVYRSDGQDGAELSTVGYAGAATQTYLASAAATELAPGAGGYFVSCKPAQKAAYAEWDWSANASAAAYFDASRTWLGL